jgi:hypothetical protein
MKINHLAIFVIVIGLVFAPASEIFAKGKSQKPAPKKEIPPNHSVVTDISDSSITISTKGGSHTYSIGEYTTIIVDGVRGKASDIKKGMRATVGADSAKKATTINCSPAPAGKK